MNPYRTLGPRGDVGVNHCAVDQPLRMLTMLVEAVKLEPGNVVRCHQRANGETFISDRCRKMGGRKIANARRRRALVVH